MSARLSSVSGCARERTPEHKSRSTPKSDHIQRRVSDPKEDEEPNREKDKYSNGMNQRRGNTTCQSEESRVNKLKKLKNAVETGNGGQCRAEDTMYTSWEAWIRRVAEKARKAYEGGSTTPHIYEAQTMATSRTCLSTSR